VIKKVKDLIKIIEEDGWFLHSQTGSHKHYKHPVKKGKVTIPDHGKNTELGHKTVKSIFEQADLK
jgi:predicted RNA binding protein YcfA (HicA-like mRNA interferase family)